MAATLFVRHSVDDYDSWRKVYDEVEDLRQKYGCFGAEVMVSPSDRQDVFVIHRFPTLDEAQGFAGDPELRDAMGRAGVHLPPRIEIVVEA
jgi:hypothetical protein